MSKSKVYLNLAGFFFLGFSPVFAIFSFFAFIASVLLPNEVNDFTQMASLLVFFLSLGGTVLGWRGGNSRRSTKPPSTVKS